MSGRRWHARLANRGLKRACGAGECQLAMIAGITQARVTDANHQTGSTCRRGPGTFDNKLLPLLGEQLLVYCQDGMIRIFADRNADDNEEAACRYQNRAYATNLRLMSTGWNQTALCGI